MTTLTIAEPAVTVAPAESTVRLTVSGGPGPAGPSYIRLLDHVPTDADWSSAPIDGTPALALIGSAISLYVRVGGAWVTLISAVTGYQLDFSQATNSQYLGAL